MSSVGLRNFPRAYRSLWGVATTPTPGSIVVGHLVGILSEEEDAP